MNQIERTSTSLLGYNSVSEHAIFKAEINNFQPKTPSIAERIIASGKSKILTAGLAVTLTISGCGGSQQETPTPLSPTTQPTEIPTLFPTPMPTIESTTTPQSTPNSDTSLQFMSVDTMSLSQDTLRDPLTMQQKETVVQHAKDLGVTHVAIDTPYDLPSTPDPATGEDLNAASVTETEQWLETTRDQGLSVIHRSNPAPFDGMPYFLTRDPNLDYVQIMKQYLLDHPDFFQPGDIFVPIREPDSLSVVGENCDPDNPPDQGKCMFNSPAQFNIFIQNIVQAARDTLKQLDKQDVTVLCCGFNGYTVTGKSPGDHEFLFPETVKEIGSISVDHYPLADARGNASTYAQDLKIMEEQWPGVPIYLTEFGTIPGVAEPLEDIINDIKQDPNVLGVNWWQMGPTTNTESLLNNDLSVNQRFNDLKDAYADLKQKRGLSKQLPQSALEEPQHLKNTNGNLLFSQEITNTRRLYTSRVK